jgi:Polyphosphate kinase 2 (PPK2)
VDLLADYQDRLAAQDTFGVLLVLQGIDAAGKVGTIKYVMSGVNPQAVEVRAFKQPSAAELNHDFLWRYQRALPGRGRIGIFNRSHYEEVLVVRVHGELLAAERMPALAGDDGIWARRYFGRNPKLHRAKSASKTGSTTIFTEAGNRDPSCPEAPESARGCGTGQSQRQPRPTALARPCLPRRSPPGRCAPGLPSFCGPPGTS